MARTRATGYLEALKELQYRSQMTIFLTLVAALFSDVVLLDEPNRGIDVGARSAIYYLISALAKKGVAVVIVSSDLEEVLGVSNRILVMAAGRKTGILSGAWCSQNKVLAFSRAVFDGPLQAVDHNTHYCARCRAQLVFPAH